MPDDSDKPSVKIWLAVIGAISAIGVALIPVLRPSGPTTPEKIILEGVVMRDEANPEKRFPISNVIVSATDGLGGSAATTADGMFRLELKPEAKGGAQIALNFKHPDYQERDVIQAIGQGVPYIFYMWPSQYAATTPGARVIPAFYAPVVSRTFQIPNRGSVRCNNQQPCSPDGKWKAALASATIDAGPGHVFISGRADCVAGPCPWSAVETKGFPQIGQRTINVSVRAWSDTVTYRLSGEIR